METREVREYKPTYTYERKFLIEGGHNFASREGTEDIENSLARCENAR